MSDNNDIENGDNGSGNDNHSHKIYQHSQFTTRLYTPSASIERQFVRLMELRLHFRGFRPKMLEIKKNERNNNRSLSRVQRLLQIDYFRHVVAELFGYFPYVQHFINNWKYHPCNNCPLQMPRIISVPLPVSIEDCFCIPVGLPQAVIEIEVLHQNHNTFDRLRYGRLIKQYVLLESIFYSSVYMHMATRNVEEEMTSQFHNEQRSELLKAHRRLLEMQHQKYLKPIVSNVIVIETDVGEPTISFSLDLIIMGDLPTSTSSIIMQQPRQYYNQTIVIKMPFEAIEPPVEMILTEPDILHFSNWIHNTALSTMSIGMRKKYQQSVTRTLAIGMPEQQT